jgi:hypothetical protein
MGKMNPERIMAGSMDDKNPINQAVWAVSALLEMKSPIPRVAAINKPEELKRVSRFPRMGTWKINLASRIMRARMIKEIII